MKIDEFGKKIRQEKTKLLKEVAEIIKPTIYVLNVDEKKIQ